MNLNYIDCPCKSCDKHTEFCHSVCQYYKDYREEYDKEIKRLNKERYIDVQIVSMKKERNARLRRKYGEIKP
jgi:hypothetical protein